jgi:hypothetical protein
VFVEEFILDHTLTPALDEFGLEHVRLIDPLAAPGISLSAFHRLFDQGLPRAWHQPACQPSAL